MAVIRLAVKIESVAAPRGRGLDAEDLSVRVSAELRELLAREPLRRLPSGGATVSVPGGPVRIASLASPSAVAHALARRVHDGLQAPEAPR
jgi:hypothetical protein